MFNEALLQYGSTPASAGGGIGIVIFYLVVFAYFGFCIFKIAQRVGMKKAWLGWIPIVQAFVLLKIAKKPMWWFILLMIPFVNIIFTIIVWMKISERLGHKKWLGLLMIVPIANLVLPAFLAFSKGDNDSEENTGNDNSQNEVDQMSEENEVQGEVLHDM